MTIFQIECFLAVAEHLNFARGCYAVKCLSAGHYKTDPYIRSRTGYPAFYSAVQEWYDSRKMDVFSSQMPSL